MTNNQFDLWGLSREWRKNFIAASFAVLCSTVVYLKFDGDRRENRLINENLDLQKRVVECEQKSAAIIDKLRAEQIHFINGILTEKQEVDRELQRLAKRIKK